MLDAGHVIHWSSGRECHNNYRRDLVIWLIHLIYSAVGFVLCYNYVILNYCIRFAVLPCVRLCLNSCFTVSRIIMNVIKNLSQAKYILHYVGLHEFRRHYTFGFFWC